MLSAESYNLYSKAKSVVRSINDTKQIEATIGYIKRFDKSVGGFLATELGLDFCERLDEMELQAKTDIERHRLRVAQTKWVNGGY